MTSGRRYYPIFVLLIVLALVISLTLIISSSKKDTPPPDLNLATSTIERIVAPRGTITVEVADTSDLRELGLSGHASLAPDRGMLFVFEQSGTYGFWMKDMNFSLDMVWIDANKKVVGVAIDVPPSSYPNAFFPPSQIKYVLEINANSATRFGIATGTMLKF